ncbi:MAG: response regulator [Terrimicrobiaceae bacterium]|nr:response regulator [Terrimicrobiaceae bacterium]
MNPTPQSRCSVLYIDDEEKSLKYFRMAFAPTFPILTASSGEEGLALLRKEAGKIGILVSDQRMPGMLGANVLGVAREEFPRIVRILTTAYSDLDSAILAVNKGYIYQYVVKPWDVTELEMVLHRAAEYYQILSERDQLLRLKMSTLQRILCCDRVKWLIMTFCIKFDPPACAFRQALFSLLRALKDLPPFGQADGHVFRAGQFDATTLIQEEVGMEILLKSMLLDKGRTEGVLPECEQVSKLGERGPILADVLGAFLSSLWEDAVASVKTSGGVEVTLSSPSPGFSGELTGILFSRGPRQFSVHLLKLLWRFAEAGVPLTFVVERPGNEDLRFSLATQEVFPNDVLGALREVFERWDVASL